MGQVASLCVGRPFSIRYPLTMEIILATQRSNFKCHGVVSGGWGWEDSEQVLVIDANHAETMVVLPEVDFSMMFLKWRTVGVLEGKVEGLMKATVCFLGASFFLREEARPLAEM